MLKFADLNVDMKSFENTLDSYMKLFPNSYMPLLIMYLSREGLLKVESDIDENNPKILLSVTKDELSNFMPLFPYDADVNTKVDFMKKEFGIDMAKGGADIDLDVLLAILDSFPKTDKEVKKYSFIYHSNADEDINRIKNIILSNSPQIKEKAALWFFCNLFIHKVPTRESEEKDWMFQDAVECFEMTLKRLFAFSGKQEFMQPIELSRIILSQYMGGSVYNPFAGVASYHIAMSYGLNSDHSEFVNGEKPILGNNSLGKYYYGEEHNELTWAVGKLRLMFYHMDSPNYILGDSTKEFEGSVNNILCTPPFNLQIINESGKKEFADHFVIRRGISMLADEGMMAIVVPISFFRRRDTFDIRKDLISKRLLTHVVYLPENVLSSTRISTAIIFVHKGSKQSKLKFIDATSRRYNIGGLNLTAISNLIVYNQYPISGFTYGEFNYCDELTPAVFNACISFEDYGNIAANDYDLSPSYYISSYIDIPDGFKLERLVKFVEKKVPANVTADTEGKVITISDMAKDSQIPYIDFTTLGNKVVNTNYKVLEKKSLLVSSMNDLKPSLFVPNDANAYVSPNVLAFYLNEKKINAEYLVGELSKDYVKEQLRLKTMGSVVHRIKLSDILALQILVPDSKDSLRIEKEIVVERKNDYLEKIGVELSELKDKRHDEYVKMLRQRKHRISQLLNELGPGFNLLNICRIENNGVLHDNDVVAERTGETVDNYFCKLKHIVSKIENLVANLVDKDHWGKPAEINIDDYADNISRNHLSNKFDIQIQHHHDVYIEEEGESIDLNDARIIKINEDDLTILFDNIIANAAKWGFTEDMRKDYRLRIELYDGVLGSQQAIRICISNNGNPIHSSVDRKRFFEWGYGSGTGIGTWQLKDIVEHYGGTIRLNEYPDEISGFQTEYEIILPLADKY